MREDLGHGLQGGDQAAVLDLDVWQVSMTVTSVQNNLRISLHFQFTLDLL